MNDGNADLAHEAGRYSLRFQRLLPHPPERVWSAITEEDQLAHWFPARMVGAREAGASLQFIFPPVPGQVPADTTEQGLTMSGEMLIFEPPLVVEYRWDDDLLRFDLEQRPGGTLLTFTHTFDDQGRGARDAAGWEICFASLEARLDGVSAEPFTSQRHQELYDGYAQKFGPDAAVHVAPPL